MPRYWVPLPEGDAEFQSRQLGWIEDDGKSLRLDFMNDDPEEIIEFRDNERLCRSTELSEEDANAVGRVRDILSKHLQSTVHGFDRDKAAIQRTWEILARAIGEVEETTSSPTMVFGARPNDGYHWHEATDVSDIETRWVRGDPFSESEGSGE